MLDRLYGYGNMADLAMALRNRNQGGAVASAVPAAPPRNFGGSMEDLAMALENRNNPSAFSEDLALLRNKLAEAENSKAMRPAQAASKPEIGYKLSKTSGREMEANSKSSLDALLDRLDSARAVDADKDRRMAWMNFAAAMANSKSPTILGGVAEGVGAMAPTIERQEAVNKQNQIESLRDRIRAEQVKNQERMMERRMNLMESREARAASSARKKSDGTPTISQQMQLARYMVSNPMEFPDEQVAAAKEFLTSALPNNPVKNNVAEPSMTKDSMGFEFIGFK